MLGCDGLGLAEYKVNAPHTVSPSGPVAASGVGEGWAEGGSPGQCHA